MCAPLWPDTQVCFLLLTLLLEMSVVSVNVYDGQGKDGPHKIFLTGEGIYRGNESLER